MQENKPCRLKGAIVEMRPLGTARNGSPFIHFRLVREDGKPSLFCSAFGDRAKNIDREFGNGCLVELYGQFDRGQNDTYRFRVFGCDGEA